MLKRLLGFLWRKAPSSVRRWGVWFIEPRFTVTIGAVVVDERRRVLLLKHVFRSGSGWGLPGGFIERGEQPEEAVRRELREEAGVELDKVEIAFVRTSKQPQRVEIMYRCHAREAATARPQSLEIKSATWFGLDALPPELTLDQRRIIERVLNSSTKTPD